VASQNSFSFDNISYNSRPFGFVSLFVKAKLIEKNKESSDVTSFIFQTERPVQWKAGQYIFYRIEHSNSDNRGPIRHFTIAAAPFEKNMMLTTKFPQDKTSSFKQALDNLSIGNEVKAFSIDGKFVIKNPKKRYIFIAGGIGITPFRSILFDLDHNNSLNEIILLYANRNQEIVFKQELDKLAEKNSGLKIYYIIDPQKIDSDLIKEKIQNFSDCVYYISGTKGFVNAMKKLLKEIGVKKRKIKSDYFPGYKD
jgi:ferredoxin-NADP reductase